MEDISVNKYEIKDEDLKKTTSKYPLVKVAICPQTLDKVPDIATGGNRSRRYGCTLSLGILPFLEEIEEPVMVNSDMPTMMVDGDTLDQVKDRVMAEIEIMFEAFEDQKKIAEAQEKEEPAIQA